MESCTWIFNNESVETVAQQVKDSGLNKVELHSNIHSINPVHAGKTFSNLKLKIFSITPDNTDISYSDPQIRANTTQYYKALIK